MTSKIGHKELTQVDVHDARIFGQAAAIIIQRRKPTCCNMPNTKKNYYFNKHYHPPQFCFSVTHTTFPVCLFADNQWLTYKYAKTIWIKKLK